MKDNHKLGIVLSVIGILTGMVILFLMADIYQPTSTGRSPTDAPTKPLPCRSSSRCWVGWAPLPALCG